MTLFTMRSYIVGFQIYRKDGARQSVLDLDAVVSNPQEFTISFAVKTDTADKINEKDTSQVLSLNWAAPTHSNPVPLCKSTRCISTTVR